MGEGCFEEDSPEREWWRSCSAEGAAACARGFTPDGGWEKMFSDRADEAGPPNLGEAEPRDVAGGGRQRDGMVFGVFLPDVEPAVQSRGGREAAARLAALPKEFEILVQELAFKRRIGKGALGDVLQATWQGTSVAVKVLNPDQVSEKSLEDFRREVGMLLVLHHPNVVLFMGVATVAPDLCIVMEYATHGSLTACCTNTSWWSTTHGVSSGLRRSYVG